MAIVKCLASGRYSKDISDALKCNRTRKCKYGILSTSQVCFQGNSWMPLSVTKFGTFGTCQAFRGILGCLEV